ncbi:MAG: hypothetical protein KBC73_17190 [Burkholderiaceae bacterium]|nr:hypothetical protein [Burkholderiaceae bacterium]
MHGPPAPRPAGRTVVMLHALAPAKPAAGQACNGCGLCCAWQPCPLGMLASRRRHGACRALWWDAADGRYRCALLSGARRLWPRLPRPLEAGLAVLARRWIAAGIGCDSSLETETTPH